MSTEEPPHLGPGTADRIAAIVRGGGALIPHGGGFLSTIIGSLIPGQRMDRLEEYVALIASKVDNLDETQRTLIAASPEHIDLFEEGAFRAARALHRKRIEHIALIVAIGLTKDSADALAQKRLLTIFSDLDDDDIRVLYWHLRKNKQDGMKFALNHPDLFPLDLKPITPWASREDREKDALRKAIDFKLVRYGLIEMRDDQRPAGMSPHQSEYISQLGLLILRTAELIENEIENSGTGLR